MSGDPELYDDEPHGPRPFDSFDLSVMIRDGGPPPPELICGDMIYPGCVHSISGAPESGKTTLALWWALQLLRLGGTVVFLDEEGGPELTASRLVSLGATEAEVAKLLYYPFAARAWSDPDIHAWHTLVGEHKPDLMIVDSVAVSMGNAGLDENATKDVTRFYTQLMLPCARRYGAAVLLIDHDTKSDDGRSRYSAGNKSKLGSIDVQFKVSTTQAFSRAESGSLRLEVTKDRPGWIHPRIYRLEVSHNLDIWFASHSETVLAEAARLRDKLSPAAFKLLALLDDPPGKASGKRLGDRVAAAYGNNLARETISRELANLAALGLAVKVHPGGAGAGDAALWQRKAEGKAVVKDAPPPPQGALPMDRPNE